MNSKRIIALISSIVLCCGTLVTPQVADIISNSIVASADSFTVTTSVPITITTTTPITTTTNSNFTGSCGENATYSFDSSTDTLTISGTGDMADYEDCLSIPWYSFAENIKKVIMNSGITSIGEYSFGNCTSLINVTIPNGVTSIGHGAFINCTSLTDIVIPNSVTFVNDFVFSDCTSLTNITIPNSVTFIGNHAFQNCTSLTSVVIPNNVTSIGNYAFYNCTSLKDVYYTGTQEEWNKIEIDKNNNEPLTNATIHYKQNDNTMVFGQDNWNFINDSMYFGKESSKTYISPKDRIKLLKSLSNTERVKVLDYLNEDWQGSCYGMSVTEILAKIGIFDVNKWNNSSHNLFELPTLDYDTNSAEESLINYYQVLQLTDLVQQELCNNLTNRKDEDIVADLLEMVSTVKTGDTPILVCYSNHAVVAYDVEDTYKVINGVKYDKKILVMDCNCTGQSDDACIYVNSSSNRWCVPYTNLSSDNQYTRMMLVTNNIELLNNKGYFETPMGYSSNDQYISVLEFNYNDNFNISKTIESNGKWINSTANGVPDGELFYNFFSNDNSNNIIAKTTLKDSLSGYSYSTEKPSEMDLNMSYKDCYLTINADSSSIVKFAPKGYISMEGKNSNYSMDMVFNEGYYSLPWSNIQLNGKNANNISMDKIDDGIIISGDNLTNVEVSAISDTVYTKVIFSTKYDKVLAYSIDDYTMGIKIDTDNNGTFETLLAQSKDFNKIKDFSIVGDINDDNQVSYIDLLLLKRYILNTEISGLDISKLDINEDSNINLFDLLDLKKCIIE